VDVGRASDGTSIHVAGGVFSQWPRVLIFSNLLAACEFFRTGLLGYLADASGSRLYGIELNCYKRQVETRALERLESSFLREISVFPRGTVHVDRTLLMRGIGHRWDNRGALCCG